MFNWFSSPPAPPPTHASFMEAAIVVQPIAPRLAGLVTFQGRWWKARCIYEMVIEPNTLVEVLGSEDIYLIVQPLSMG